MTEPTTRVQDDGRTYPESIEHMIRNAPEGEETVFQLRESLDEGETLRIERRKLQPEEPKTPKRKESPRRTHAFLALGGFLDYLRRYASPRCVIFACPGGGRLNSGTVEAVLDETSSGGFEVASDHLLIPQLTAALAEAGLGHIAVVVGGIIPESDQQWLHEARVEHIFHPGTPLPEIAQAVGELAARARARDAVS